MKNPPCILLLLGFFLSTQAQVTKLKNEHPILGSIHGFTLYDYEMQDFGAYSFCDVNGEDYIIEGQISYYYYEFSLRIPARFRIHPNS